MKIDFMSFLSGIFFFYGLNSLLGAIGIGINLQSFIVPSAFSQFANIIVGVVCILVAYFLVKGGKN
ncbi:hypothetical protein COT30_03900 [Candidatus Micrarchaeota archaeon CG08_land_8_20_14_0_20_49_17]|nr:MAG: hypothetical protein AUJ13_04480 [Candidatus Micrarchaeota archaeon CG1_02_49_24]PIU09538.1 MAG: hypothetical protein COT30_03900 [Candidatus Micrarchaeota archaeon CG08_land_8_20_14_0_20_49_17]PIU81645.1 MAG: hypothetical protein COS70_03010 [Candidatus Micrarchaeota archaeon CG06_land_8_20_14_3_00_50_6]PIZ97584.1 MAG: hypothetical protein COX84_03035 [Candidatus Micrarchaeota archaeon CG_4_10_14_0_2_um_filter_49_7]HII54341.1 hypothetical protein [Candidatus Micrarchaeota archaeon]